MTSNDYLNQVVQEQAAVENQLRQRRPLLLSPPAGNDSGSDADHEDREESRTVAPASNYRVTGFWRWKTVIVPPNMYVVHTRRGQSEPLHIGLGVSFKYNP